MIMDARRMHQTGCRYANFHSPKEAIHSPKEAILEVHTFSYNPPIPLYQPMYTGGRNRKKSSIQSDASTKAPLPLVSQASSEPPKDTSMFQFFF